VIDLDTRLLAYAIWGIGTLFIYGLILARSVSGARRHHDARSRRELYGDLAYFIVALASSVSITFALFGEPGTGLRGLVIASALGAFTAAGVVKLKDVAPPSETDEGHPKPVVVER